MCFGTLLNCYETWHHVVRLWCFARILISFWIIVDPGRCQVKDLDLFIRYIPFQKSTWLMQQAWRLLVILEIPIKVSRVLIMNKTSFKCLIEFELVFFFALTFYETEGDTRDTKKWHTWHCFLTSWLKFNTSFFPKLWFLSTRICLSIMEINLNEEII